MKITSVEMMHADAGWRPWSFVKIMTDEGLVGWSECTDSHGSPRGMAGVVEDMKPLLIGQDPREIEKLMWQMHSRKRQRPGQRNASFVLVALRHLTRSSVADGEKTADTNV